MIYYRDLTKSIHDKIPPHFQEGAENTDVFLAHLESLDTFMELKKLTRTPVEKSPCDEVPREHIMAMCHFLGSRWERIRQTKLAYTQYTNLTANELCIELAKLIGSTVKKSYLVILMPTLAVRNCAITGTELTDEDLCLRKFVLSDDDSCIIEVGACLEFAKETALLHHTSILDKNDRTMLLSASERRRVVLHTKESYEFYNAIERYLEAYREDTSIGTMLRQLIDGLRAGGANRAGEEYNAGSDANIAILNFSEFLELLQKNWRTTYYEDLMGRANFRDLWHRLARPTECRYRDTMYCVELTAGEIEDFLDRNQDLYEIKISRTQLNRGDCLDMRDKAERKYKEATKKQIGGICSPQYDNGNQYLREVLGVERFRLACLEQNEFELGETLEHLPTRTHDDQLRFLNYLGIERLTKILRTHSALAFIFQQVETEKAKEKILEVLIAASHFSAETPVMFLSRLSDHDAKAAINMAPEYFFRTPEDIIFYLQRIEAPGQLRWLHRFNRHKRCQTLIADTNDLITLLHALPDINSMSDLGLLLDYENLPYVCNGYEIADILSTLPMKMRFSLLSNCNKERIQQIISNGSQLGAIIRQLSETEGYRLKRRTRSAFMTDLVGIEYLRKLIDTGHHLATILNVLTEVEQTHWFIEILTSQGIRLLILDAHQLGTILAVLYPTLWPTLKDFTGERKLSSLIENPTQIGQVLAQFQHPEEHWQAMANFLDISLETCLGDHNTQALLESLPLNLRWKFLDQVLIPPINAQLRDRLHLYMDLLPKTARIRWFQKIILANQLFVICSDSRSFATVLKKLPIHSRAVCLQEAIMQYTIQEISEHFLTSFNHLIAILDLLSNSIHCLTLLRQISTETQIKCIGEFPKLKCVLDKLTSAGCAIWIRTLRHEYYRELTPTLNELAMLYNELCRLRVITYGDISHLESSEYITREHVLHIVLTFPLLPEAFVL